MLIETYSGNTHVGVITQSLEPKRLPHYGWSGQSHQRGMDNLAAGMPKQ